MPNILSNKKSLNKDIARRKVRVSELKTLKRLSKSALETKDCSGVYKKADSLVSRGIINKNKCNRVKSRLALKVNKSANS